MCFWFRYIRNMLWQQGISLYVHLPFCESLCTFCGCNKRITKRHEVEKPYIKALLKEWALYCELFETKPIIKEIHLGGGTPTFFSPQHLRELIEGLLCPAKLADSYEFSFEGHPNNTTEAHLQTLYDLGFRRVCFGVQIIYDVALFSHGTVTLYINLWENEAVSLLKSNIKRDFY